VEREDSLPHPQELSTCPYPGPDQSSRHYPILSLQDQYYPLTYVFIFLAFLSPPPLSCYMPHPSHPPRLDYSNYTWQKVQIKKLFIMEFSHPPITSSLFSPNILLSTLFSNTLSLMKIVFFTPRSLNRQGTRLGLDRSEC
jgi:hypothetical protein